MEYLAYLWDELDDCAGACRHVATWAAAEMLVPAVPLIAAAAALLLAGAATLLLGHDAAVSLLA